MVINAGLKHEESRKIKFDKGTHFIKHTCVPGQGLADGKSFVTAQQNASKYDPVQMAIFKEGKTYHGMAVQCPF